MNARSSFYGNKQRTAAERKAAMTLFLCGCTDGILATVTIDDLGRRYGLPVRDCEYALTISRQRRA